MNHQRRHLGIPLACSYKKHKLDDMIPGHDETRGREGSLHTIGGAAKLLRVCPETLRIWERKGLIHPQRLGKNRLYSEKDIRQLRAIKDLIQKKRINIEGVKAMLNTPQCWDVKKCSPRQRKACSYFIARERSNDEI